MTSAIDIKTRVDRNIDLFGDVRRFKGKDKLAARHLFSSLGHLESIAVIAAKRGDAIEGQYEDELVHMYTFFELADRLGGVVDPSEPVVKLVNYLESLEGEDSLAALNVVAESWLETVFESLADAGIASEMIEVIEEEEHRHCHDALENARPDPEAFEIVVRDLEQMLLKISYTAEFMLPLVHLMGQENVSNMGIAICDAHERGCKHLGIEPDLYDMRLASRALRMLQRTAPEPVDMNEWERTKVATWTDPAPQYCYFDLPLKDTNPIKIQAKTIECIGRIMARYPKLKNVVRGDQIYRTDTPLIGLRALYDDERVMTLWVSRAHRKDWKDIVRILNRQKKKIKDEPYEPYHGVISLGKDLEELYPPHRSSCVVTYNGDFGGSFGTGPLSGIEGVPMIVTIGRPQMKPVWDGEGFVPKLVATTCIMCDHRTLDGKDIGKMSDELIREMEKL